jgi:hypothetical protein
MYGTTQELALMKLGLKLATGMGKKNGGRTL